MSQAQRRPFWRRTFIVDRKFQLELLLRAAIYCFGMFVVLGGGVFYPLIRDVDNSKEYGDAAAAMLYMHAHFWPVAVLCVILAMMLSVHFSHRIAGPMYRMKKTFEALRGGLFPRSTTTRKRDYLKAEVAMMNDALGAIADGIEAIKSADRELSEALRICQELAQDPTGDEIRVAITMAREKAATLHRRVHYFRREGEIPAAGTTASPESSETSTLEPLLR